MAEKGAARREEACSDCQEPTRRERGDFSQLIQFSPKIFKVSGDQLTAEYFSMLSHDDIEKLNKVYKKDFEMFGYTWPAK